MSSLQEQQAILRDKERQQKLVSDTNKLLELATDLKTQVDKTNRGIMSVDVIKKADEIEKLAHSVKDRMKGWCRGAGGWWRLMVWVGPGLERLRR